MVSKESKVGKIFWLSKEIDLDKITAISGSGPGYFFLFIDILEKVAIKLGFSKKISKQLVYQTALGSVKLLVTGSKSAEELAKTIAIKGGTTEAAIKVFLDNNNFKKIINEAIYAAHKKSIELGKK